MTDANLALRVTRACAPRLSLDEATAAIEAMQKLGYEFVSPGASGRMLESDEAHARLAQYLQNETSLSFVSAIAVLDGLKHLRYQIREPDVHPSGLRTSAYAFETVVPFGAQYAAEMRTVEKSQYDTNGVEIPNR